MDRLFIAVDTKASMVAAAQKKEAEEVLAGRKPRTISPSVSNSSPSPTGHSSSPSPDGLHGRNSPETDGSPVQVVAVQSTQVVADDKKKALSRVEFLACIVHLAVNKYVMPKKIPDVSEALRRLLSDIETKLDEATFRRPNPFRRDHCYVEDVTAVLWAYGNSLRNIYHGISSTLTKSSTLERGLLSMDEWRAFMRGLGLISVDISERDVNLSFTWSRMCVVDVNSDKGRIRESCLAFLDFLEALTRIAVMKALPNDEEIEAAGCSDAFDFLSKLKATDEEKYKVFLRERRTAWGDEPAQPTWRCVAHLLGIIVHTMEQNSAGTDNLELTEAEVRSWIQRSSMVAGK